MTKKTKILLATINLIGILLLFLLASIVLAIHEAHSYSMYKEFEMRGFINKQAVKNWKSDSKEKNYSIAKRMEQIGGLNTYLNVMVFIMSIVFFINICIVLYVNTTIKEDIL